MQEFLANIVTTFGDLVASFGYIVIGLVIRRLWAVILLAVVWAVISYGLYQSDQLGIEITEVVNQIDWDAAQETLPIRLVIAVVISAFAWFCMSLMIGSFRPRKRRRAAAASAREMPSDKLPPLPRGAGGGRGDGRQEPSFVAPAPDAGQVAAPVATAAAAPAMMEPAAPPPMTPPIPQQPAEAPVAPPASGDDAYGPAATADKLGRIYSERELDDLIAALQEKRARPSED